MKKQTIRVLALVCLISITTFWQSCQEEPIDIPNDPVEVSFNIVATNSVDLKSTPPLDMENAKKVILTIQKYDGITTGYTQHELDIYKLGDAYITGKIALMFGSYKITEFFVLDDLDNIVYASPLEGSLMAQNVTDPLPVLFSISEKKSKAVEIEVLSNANLQAEDFGLVRFPIIGVGTFQFLISVSEQGMEKLLKAGLTVSSNGYSYTQELDSIVDNKLTIKDGYEEYALTITAIGYGTYKGTFTNAELKQYTIIPLIIELEYLTVTDIDGNVYRAVQIGDQVWMAENLKTTHYADGTPIQRILGDSAFAETYGALYLWTAAMNAEASSTTNPSGIQGVCPTCWHLPSDVEWTELTDYLGGKSVAGGKLKESGTTHWDSPNTGATNETGFTALPGFCSGVENSTKGYWWSATEYSPTFAYFRYMLFNSSYVFRYTYPKGYWFSVRCVRD